MCGDKSGLKSHSAFESGSFRALIVFSTFSQLHNAHQLTYDVLIWSALWITDHFDRGQQCTRTVVTGCLKT